MSLRRAGQRIGSYLWDTCRGGPLEWGALLGTAAGLCLGVCLLRQYREAAVAEHTQLQPARQAINSRSQELVARELEHWATQEINRRWADAVQQELTELAARQVALGRRQELQALLMREQSRFSAEAAQLLAARALYPAYQDTPLEELLTRTLREQIQRHTRSAE